MNSKGDELHPNWRALATVHLPLKRFIKAGEDVADGEKNSDGEKYTIEGGSSAEVRDFYENLIAEESNKNAKHSFQRVKQLSKPKRNSEEPKYKFDKNKFFRCAQENDINSLRNFKLKDGEVNACDQFGWTALMMAACAGAIDTVKFLLNLGADRYIKDKTGRTALSVARQKAFEDIAKLLENDIKLQAMPSSALPTFGTEKSSLKPFYCKICQTNFTETTLSAHRTSTVHQFNLKSMLPPNKLQRFNISNKNRGLQLMIKQGWDQENGLGPSQSGRLYPVKTTIRKQRTGLGIQQDPARVTHFEAFDERAVSRRNSDYYRKKPRNRNDIRCEKVREWKRDKRLRCELS